MFAKHGYFKEYYQDKKFIGSISNVEQDRETLGFFGAKKETLVADVKLTNKRILKAGTIVETQLHLICGTKNK